MNVLSIAQSPVIEGLCIVFLGEYFSGEAGLPTIRLHLAKLNEQTNNFQLEKELEAYSFMTVEAALEFLEQLPNMSALELILAMNSVNTSGVY